MGSSVRGPDAEPGHHRPSCCNRLQNVALCMESAAFREILPAMSQENVEIVVGLLKAWMSGDRDTARASWDSDAVMILPVIDSNVLVGLPSIERALESWRKNWGRWRFEVEEVIDAGEHVIVIGRQRAEGKESGAEVHLLSCGVWSLRNSKVIRAEFFNNKAEALGAAGLAD